MKMVIVSSRVRSSKARSLRPYQKGLIVALAVGWIVTLIGGYLLHWRWTGYAPYHKLTGYAPYKLWDWVDLLLAPLVVPTILLPALLKWVSGNAAGRASEVRKAPVIQMLRGLRQASLFPLATPNRALNATASHLPMPTISALMSAAHQLGTSPPSGSTSPLPAQ